jgi:hypothetical protein
MSAQAHAFSAAPQTAPLDVDGAARRVLETLGRPLHERATVAALETDGIRDVDAGRIAPGCADVFELGHLVHARCLELDEQRQVVAALRRPPATRQPGWQRLARRYGRGLAYSLPMVVQGLALASLHVSLWGSQQLTIEQQTAIGLALVVTLVLTGPAGQALTHRLYYYRYQEDVRALRRSALRAVGGAFAGGIAAGAASAVVLAASGRTSGAAWAFCAYLALQPAMWIANAALFAIRRSLVAASAILVPTLVVAAGLGAGLDPLAVHAAGLALADVLLVAALAVILRRTTALAPPARRPLPRAVLPLVVGGYAAWGLVYFALIFTDRLVAWLGGSPVAFHPAYEAALQIALVPLVLTLPALEHVLVRFGELLEAASRDRDPDDEAAGRRRAMRTMALQVATVTGLYAVFAGALWVIVGRRPDALPLGAGHLVATGDAHVALGIAMLAYGCFVVALGVGSAYQLLQRPWPLVAVGVCAVLADVSVGVMARVGAAPEKAVFGLLAGGIVFMLGIALVWRVQRRRLDHLWFAAG